jgi:transcriptional regulator with XRE-family HTH domain
LKDILGRKIKYYRMLHSMTQEELATEIGVESLHISCVERGNKGLGLDKLELVCKCFNITMADILPVEQQGESDMKEKWINEVLETLRALDVSQVGIVRTMVCSLRD